MSYIILSIDIKAMADKYFGDFDHIGFSWWSIRVQLMKRILWSGFSQFIMSNKHIIKFISPRCHLQCYWKDPLPLRHPPFGWPGEESSVLPLETIKRLHWWLITYSNYTSSSSWILAPCVRRSRTIAEEVLRAAKQRGVRWSLLNNHYSTKMR